MARISVFLSLAVILFSIGTNASAQDITITLDQDGALATRSIQLFLLITILSLVPGIAIMITCFPFMVTVLSILRQGIGLQQSPPNMLIVSLALFLTYFVMEPVFMDAWEGGINPMISGSLELNAAVLKTLEPFRDFMSSRSSADTFESLASIRTDIDLQMSISEAPLSLLIPSFLLSEIERAFQIGFLIFLPFLIIDLVVAAVLMSMGMMMVPPAIVSLPFKLAFFVVADGWSLVSESLVRSYL